MIDWRLFSRDIEVTSVWALLEIVERFVFDEFSIQVEVLIWSGL